MNIDRELAKLAGLEVGAEGADWVRVIRYRSPLTDVGPDAKPIGSLALEEPFAPRTNLAHAFEVVTALAAAGKHLALRSLPFPNGTVGWSARIGDGQFLQTIEGSNLAMTICMAAMTGAES